MAGMCPLPELKRKVLLLEKQLRPIANVRLKVEELQGCVLQALLSRGGRELTPLIRMMADGLNLRKAARGLGLDTEALVTETLPLDARLPWDLLYTTDGERLKAEYREAMQVIGVRG